MLNTDVKVIEVKYPPAIGKVAMQQGIRSREGAQTWARNNGYTTVYWLKSRERVYAEKHSNKPLAISVQPNAGE